MPPRPAGWVDHPVIPITRRAVLAGVAVTVLAVVVALASVYARRTRLEKTTEFWGPDTIAALQLSPHVTLYLDPPPASPDDPAARQPRVSDLTNTPGLGHLRHALLDERHYEWQTRTAASVRSLRSAETWFATLTFSDPRGVYPDATIELELSDGWVGPGGTPDRVQLIPRARPAVRHFLKTISNAQQAHYDRRQAEQP